MDFWFDDGVSEDFLKTRPFLKEIGHCGIFAVVTEWVGKPGYMTIPELATLIKEGHTIASHGTNHKLMKDMSLAESLKVFKDSKEWIIKNLGVTPSEFVAPWNILRKDQKELAFDFYEVVRPPLILHFHSRKFVDVEKTIRKYVKGPCAIRARIRTQRYDASRRYLIKKFNFHVEGT